MIDSRFVNMRQVDPQERYMGGNKSVLVSSVDAWDDKAS